MSAYYNEIDPFAAAWLRELIKAGHIAPGEVDERSITDVMPSDLAGFTQCHFFAGIGVWSYALRQAGWADDRPVWTGSCPCQPFSSAGKGKGFKDERHLWPEFYRLISQCRPATCFGEQVASKDGLAWVELVQTDMENAGYAFGAVDTCAAGFGAPHIRQRLYWVADANTDRLQGRVQRGPDTEREAVNGQAGRNGTIDRLADADNQLESATRNPQGVANDSRPSSTCGLADANCSGRIARGLAAPAAGYWDSTRAESGNDRHVSPRPTNGHWRDADWLLCRDGKWRATQSLVIEMADGLADRLGYSRFGDRWSLNPLIQKAENRVGRLKGYGNAINAEQAKSFIEAFMETTKEHQPCPNN